MLKKCFKHFAYKASVYFDMQQIIENSFYFNMKGRRFNKLALFALGGYCN